MIVGTFILNLGSINNTIAVSLKAEEGLEVVKCELVGLLGPGEHAVGQLELLLLEFEDPRLDCVGAREPERESG